MLNDHIIVENAAQLFTYDAETGIVRWKNDVGNRKIKVGDRAGAVRSNGYRVIRMQIGSLMEHRVAWFLHHGALPPCQIDHINRDKTDNRITNLRLAPRNEKDNLQNRGVLSNSRSRVTGVRRHKSANKWEARITANGVYIHLGLFENFDDAVAARKAAELKYHTFANP